MAAAGKQRGLHKGAESLVATIDQPAAFVRAEISNLWRVSLAERLDAAPRVIAGQTPFFERMVQRSLQHRQGPVCGRTAAPCPIVTVEGGAALRLLVRARA